MSAYGTEKGKARRYLHRRQAQTGRQASSHRHKAARTKELRRCTIRGRDGRMRIEEDRWRGGIQRQPTFYVKVLEGQQRKYTGYTKDAEGRKGPMPRRDTGGKGRRERWRFLFKSDIKEPVANFFSSLHRSAPRRAPRNHTRPCSIHPHTRVPGRSSGVPGGSLGLGHRRMVNVVSRSAETGEATVVAKRVNVVGWHSGFWRIRGG